MTKATEDTLSSLHGKVAETIIDTLDQSDTAAHLLVKYSKPTDDFQGLPTDVVKFLQQVREVNPSVLTVATKFLKDNNITCDGSEESEMTDLAMRLQNKSNVTKMKYED